ncbi:MAG: chitobiase/beta-hexosaminidase C-terminal domain-containing protein [Opitutales bacterium]
MIRNIHLRSCTFVGLVLLLTLPFARARDPFLTETHNDLILHVDVNGDSLVDTVLADKAGATIVVGLNLGPEKALVWTNVMRVNGFEGIDGLAFGSFGPNGVDAIAVSHRASNRVALFEETENILRALSPAQIFPSNIGPDELVSMRLGSIDTALGELLVQTTFNGAVSDAQEGLYYELDQLNHTGAGTNLQGAKHLQRLRWNDSDLPVLGVIREAEGNAFLELYEMKEFKDSGPKKLIDGSYSVSSGSKYAWSMLESESSIAFTYVTGGNTIKGALLRSGALEDAFSYNELGKGTIDMLMAFQSSAGVRLFSFLSDGSVRILEMDTRLNIELDNLITPLKGFEFSSASPIDSDNFSLTSISGDTESYEFYGYDGREHRSLGIKEPLPSRKIAPSPDNLFVFTNEPFITSQPILVSRDQKGDWTSQPVLSPEETTVEDFDNPSQGLGIPTTNVSFTDYSDGNGRFVLGNQVRPDIALYSFESRVGAVISELAADPRSGQYSDSIQVALTADNPQVLVYWSIDGDWSPYTGPIPIFSDSTLYFFAEDKDDGSRSPIFSEDYTFILPIESQDADGDLVPDFVEVDFGLDPFLSGNDADGDGAFDLEEILEGKDPNDAGDTPPSQDLALYRSAFDLGAIPEAHSGLSSSPLRSPLSGDDASAALLEVHELLDAILDQKAVSAGAIPGEPLPSAVFDALPGDTENGFLLLATQASYSISVSGSIEPIGREMLSLVSIPTFENSVVPYTFSEATLADGVTAWIDAASTYYESQERSRIDELLTLESTAKFLIFENIIASLFHDRGDIPYPAVSLSPHRESESAISFGDSPDEDQVLYFTPTGSELLALSQYQESADNGYDLELLFSQISDELDSPTSASSSAFLTLVEEVYRIATAGSESLGSFRSPVDTLRDFLRYGQLNANYAAAVSDNSGITGLNASTLLVAADVPTVFTSDLPELSVDTRTLIVTHANESGAILTSDDSVVPALSVAVLYSEVSSLANQSFGLLPETTILVTGYVEDPSDNPWSADMVLDPISIELLSVPTPQQVDSNNNLLEDSFETIFFGGLTAGPLGTDSDDDGFSDFQEAIEGTSPTDGLSFPSGFAFSPSLQNIQMFVDLVADEFVMQFNYPGIFSEQVNFDIYQSDDLRTWSPTGVQATYLGNGSWEASVAQPPLSPKKFFRSVLSLAP